MIDAFQFDVAHVREMLCQVPAIGRGNEEIVTPVHDQARGVHGRTQAPWHAAADGSFTVLRSGIDDVPDVVYIEQLTSALYLDKREDVDHYLKTINNLTTKALTPAQTAQFLTEVIKDI